MPQPIVYVDTSIIREGKLEPLQEAMESLAAFVKVNVPQLRYYGFFLNEDRTEMTVVAIHPDSASLEFHLDVGNAEFRKFSDLIELSSIVVYGHVSAAALERLHRKTGMLGSGTVTVYEFHAGFAR